MSYSDVWNKELRRMIHLPEPGNGLDMVWNEGLGQDINSVTKAKLNALRQAKTFENYLSLESDNERKKLPALRLPATLARIAPPPAPAGNNINAFLNELAAVPIAPPPAPAPIAPPPAPAPAARIAPPASPSSSDAEPPFGRTNMSALLTADYIKGVRNNLESISQEPKDIGQRQMTYLLDKLYDMFYRDLTNLEKDYVIKMFLELGWFDDSEAFYKFLNSWPSIKASTKRWNQEWNAIHPLRGEPSSPPPLAPGHGYGYAPPPAPGRGYGYAPPPAPRYGYGYAPPPAPGYGYGYAPPPAPGYGAFPDRREVSCYGKNKAWYHAYHICTCNFTELVAAMNQDLQNGSDPRVRLQRCIEARRTDIAERRPTGGNFDTHQATIEKLTVLLNALNDKWGRGDLHSIQIGYQRVGGSDKFTITNVLRTKGGKRKSRRATKSKRRHTRKH